MLAFLSVQLANPIYCLIESSSGSWQYRKAVNRVISVTILAIVNFGLKSADCSSTRVFTGAM